MFSIILDLQISYKNSGESPCAAPRPPSFEALTPAGVCGDNDSPAVTGARHPDTRAPLSQPQLQAALPLSCGAQRPASRAPHPALLLLGLDHHGLLQGESPPVVRLIDWLTD